MSTLKLVLKKKWYYLIDSGVKKEEYRQIPFWSPRIYDKEGLPRHDRVLFYLGYNKERPSMEFSIENVHIGQGKPEWGAVSGKEYIVIKLGERIK